MSAANFNTRNDTFRKMMGNGLSYRIPKFQRDYSWEEDHWEDLWLDILGMLEKGGEPAHYMGYLVLQSADERNYDVIDGQQRLTTLSLIVLAGLKNLKKLVDGGSDPENNRLRMEQIRQTYIGYLDPVTLVSRSRLTLNRNNDHYFQNYLIPLLDKLPVRGFRASEHNLRKAFQWYEKRIRDHVKGLDSPGVALAKLIEGMSDRLFFTVITVTDELNAYKVFETLNARGVRLSATDMLKNHLFSVLHGQNSHESELKILEDRWERIVGRLGSESFPGYLRAHWNSRYPTVRQIELFKTIRKQIGTRERAFESLRHLEEDIDAYLGLAEPEGGTWGGAIKRYAATLKMFSVRQPYPLLMAAWRRFEKPDFEQLIRACVMISFRYNVIGNHRTGDQERIYGALAQRLSGMEEITVQKAIQALRDLYPDDKRFKLAFAAKSIRTTQSHNNRIVRYILCQLEKHLTNTDHDFDSQSLTIEHVFPRSPEQGWQAFSVEQEEGMTYRLGNMVLLESGMNRQLGNAGWSIKQETLRNSAFALAKRLAGENRSWTPERLEAHQNWMATQATAIWRIPQLSR